MDLTKSICPPVEIAVWQPGAGRPYTECSSWLASALDRVRSDHPRLVVVGVARHYGPEYRFTVYSKAWLDGLASVVAQLRATGTAVVVLGPTPRPSGDVPECLAGHLATATACGRPVRDAVDSNGAAAERRAATTVGGSYLDVVRWVCGQRVCPPMVGDLLVYRDDNHLTTSITGWLTPVLGAALAPAWAAP